MVHISPHWFLPFFLSFLLFLVDFFFFLSLFFFPSLNLFINFSCSLQKEKWSTTNPRYMLFVITHYIMVTAFSL